MKCEKCGNTLGFCLGTCLECYWNPEDNQYTRITVNTVELEDFIPPRILNSMIKRHDLRVKKD